MKQGYSRKINLKEYGGKSYESFDVWGETEDPNETFDDVKKKVDEFIIKTIKGLAKEEQKFREAIPTKEPFSDGDKVTLG